MYLGKGPMSGRGRVVGKKVDVNFADKFRGLSFSYYTFASITSLGGGKL